MYISISSDTNIVNRTQSIVIKKFVGDEIFNFYTSRKQTLNTFFRIVLFERLSRTLITTSICCSFKFVCRFSKN